MLLVLTSVFRINLREALGQVSVSMGYFVFPALLLVAIGHNPLSKILSNKLLSGLGRFSMGIYLLHMIMMKLLIVYNILTGERIDFASFKVLSIYVMAVVGVSILWHMFIEKELSSKVIRILEARVENQEPLRH